MSNTEQGNSSAPNGSNGQGGPKKKSRRPRNNKNRNRNRNKNTKRKSHAKGSTKNLSGFEKIERAYLNLLEKHLESRKKYYDLFHRADPRQLAKLEKSFYRTLSELREYEDNIKDEYKERFDKKYNGLDLDHTYSSNHEISPDHVPVPTEGEFDDPHLLPTQAESSYAEDTEESVGSIEDYNQYKGL